MANPLGTRVHKPNILSIGLRPLSFLKDRLFRQLLALFWLIAAFFILLHIGLEFVVADSGFRAGHHANLGRDRGYGERYEYILLSLTALAFAFEFLRRHAVLYLVAAFVFAFLVVDNMFGMHEAVGRALVDAGLFPAYQFGELLFFAVEGLAIACGLILGIGTDPVEDQARALGIMLLILPIAAFGVVIDAAHSAISTQLIWNSIFKIVEEGGEMLMICLPAAAAVTLAVRGWAGVGGRWPDRIALYLRA